MLENEVAKKKRLRGQVLLFLQTNHEAQNSRVDDLELWGLMQDLHFGVGQNQVLTLLQDLCERGCLKYTEVPNRITGRMRLAEIQLTARGRDLVERTIVDPAVLVP